MLFFCMNSLILFWIHESNWGKEMVKFDPISNWIYRLSCLNFWKQLRCVSVHRLPTLLEMSEVKFHLNSKCLTFLHSSISPPMNHTLPRQQSLTRSRFPIFKRLRIKLFSAIWIFLWRTIILYFHFFIKKIIYTKKFQVNIQHFSK